MTLRTRILAATGLLVLLPVALLALGGRGETTRRLRQQHAEGAEALRLVLERSLDLRAARLSEGLTALAADLREDLELRRLIANPDASDRRRIDYAESRMRLMGWQYLQILDETGRILSSGHFRATADRHEPRRAAALSRLPEGSALVTARRPGGDFLVLARVDSLHLDGRLYRLMGGLEVNRAFLDELAGASLLGLDLIAPEGPLLPEAGRDGTRVDGPALPHLRADGALGSAELRIVHPRESLEALLEGFDLWLLLTLAATLAGSLILVYWVSSRLSRPLRELAEQTGRLDLDNLAVEFREEGAGEVGALSRTLSRLSGRLRESADLLREAERRATLGDLARQVTHDVRNGFTPIRHVVAHFSQVARQEPERLPELYLERESTLDSGLEYLEDLAGHYARLSPRRSPEPVALAALLGELLPPGLTDGKARYRLDLAAGLPPVHADRGSLRRILENLLRNARESLGGAGGTVTVSGRLGRDEHGEERLTITVADDGCGIPAEARARIFDDFYTSKADGSGLGLSIVRRLVADLGGKLSVESEPDEGSAFTVSLPSPSGEHPAADDPQCEERG